MRTVRNAVVLVVVNSVVSTTAYAAAASLTLPEAVDWWAQTHTTVGYGNLPAGNDPAHWIAAWFMVSNFYLTLLLAAHIVAWILPDAWTHAEAEETEAKINAIVAHLGITPDEVSRQMLLDNASDHQRERP